MVVLSLSPAADDDTVRVLHVSDIHLNPLAAGLVVELATDLDVDAILDTGDQRSLVKQALKDEELSEKSFSPVAIGVGEAATASYGGWNF